MTEFKVGDKVIHNDPVDGVLHEVVKKVDTGLNGRTRVWVEAGGFYWPEQIELENRTVTKHLEISSWKELRPHDVVDGVGLNSGHISVTREVELPVSEDFVQPKGWRKLDTYIYSEVKNRQVLAFATKGGVKWDYYVREDEDA